MQNSLSGKPSLPFYKKENMYPYHIMNKEKGQYSFILFTL